MAAFSAITGQKLGIFPRLAARLAGLGLVGAVLSGCPTGGTLEDPECYQTGGCGSGGGSGAGTCDATPVFAQSCGSAFCHGGPGAPPVTPELVDLFNPGDGMTLGQTLLNKAATYPGTASAGECPPAAGPELIINGTDAASSLLVTKVTGTLGAPFACGATMPPTGFTPVSAADVDCLTKWVNNVVETGGL